MNDTLGILIILAVLVVLIYLYWKLRPGAVSTRLRPQAVYYILLDIRFNLALIEAFHKLDKAKSLEMTNWEIYGGRVAFLSKEIKDELKETFALAVTANQQIRTSAKAKDTSFLDINLNPLREKLLKCRTDLEEWLERQTGSKDWKPKSPGFLSLMLGER